MYKILEKHQLNQTTTLMKVHAPEVLRHAKVGQFIMLRVHADGERIPLTIAGMDMKKGSVTIIFQVVGKTTYLLNQLNEGDQLHDFVGPLGMPTMIDGYKKVIVVAGGVGSAIAMPLAKALFEQKIHVDVIVGFRSKDQVILEDTFRSNADHFYITTDDGTYGEKGFVTEVLKRLLDADQSVDHVFAIGPIPMMKFVSLLTKQYDIPTTVSLNPIMVDGTGMCGGCRVKVGEHIKFACVDGPDFDGHQVDFDLLMKRNQSYRDKEKQAFDEVRGVCHE